MARVEHGQGVGARIEGRGGGRGAPTSPRRWPLALLAVAAALSLTLVACGDDDDSEGADRDVAASDLRIPGMEGVAEVSFDEQGVLHAQCVSDEDCARVLGYFHAHHRFWQMDLQRRVARGRLATLIPMQLGMDIYHRAFLSTADGKPIEEEIERLLDEEERQLLEGYSQGVNAWLADLRAGRNGARLSAEYESLLVAGDLSELPHLIPDWEPLDSIAFVRLMTMLLSDSSERELDFGAAFAKLAAISPEMAFDFLTLRPGMKAYTVPAAEGPHPLRLGPTPEALRALGERLREAEGLLERARATIAEGSHGWGADFGSNNWVLAPSRTEEGKAILANDPHLALGNPSIFYLAHLDARTKGEGSLNVAGATFPGIPVVAIGRNERVAWGATVAFYDVTDLYIEELNEAGDAVIFDGEEVPLVQRTVAFEVGGREEPTEVVLEWVPHHGPILDKDVASRSALTVKWTGHEATNELRAFLGLNRAQSVAEARDALRNFEVGAQSFVLADVDGAIGLYPHARIPRRPWASFSSSDPGSSLPPWMPLPGDGSAEWEGFLDEADLPAVFDPPAGFIATANQDLTGATEDGDPTDAGGPMLQNLAAPGFRMARILDELEAGGTSHTVASSQDLQMDTHSVVGEVVVGHLRDAAEGADLSADATRLLDVLEAWSFTCPTGLDGNDPRAPLSSDEVALRESRGCAAFHFMLPRLISVAFGDRMREAGGITSSDTLVRPLVIGLERQEELLDPDSFWNDLGEERTREEVLVEALERAGSEIVGPLGADPAGWSWGRMHTVTFRTELSMLAPELDIGPFAAPGGLFTVNVANPSVAGGGYGFSNGASLRIVNELGEEGIATWLQLPGGRDIHRDSPHYGDLIEGWLEGRSFALPFDEAEVREAAAASLTVGP